MNTLFASAALSLAVALPAPALNTPAPAREGFDHQHTLLTELLQAHVREGLVDYRGLQRDKAKLKRYLKGMQAVSAREHDSWSRDQRHAFWINAYNAHVLEIVVDNYPVDSIKDLGGLIFNKVWDKRFIELNALHPDGKDKELSLNEIEHEILRPRFKDARVHAAINCASYSCPVLADTAFVAEKLDEQLERQMRLFVNDPERNRYDRAENRLYLSEIFDWFEDDFERDAKTVKAYVSRYYEGDATWISGAKVRYIDYDWSLNEVEEPAN